MEKGNLVKFEGYVCKDMYSVPEITERTAVIVGCHDSYYSIVCLDNGSVIAIRPRELGFLDKGGDFLFKAIEQTKQQEND